MFKSMFAETDQAYENLFGETMKETLDHSKKELVYHDGVLYELVPMAERVITEGEYQEMKDAVSEWRELYKQASDICDSWHNRYDELHAHYLSLLHDYEAMKAKSGMYKEQCDDLRRKVASIGRKEDDARKVSKANVRLRKQLNKKAKQAIEGGNDA